VSSWPDDGGGGTSASAASSLDSGGAISIEETVASTLPSGDGANEILIVISGIISCISDQGPDIDDDRHGSRQVSA
jgi:hypothetical protein